MTATETQLVKALQARVTIIADEASRRDPERHMQRLKKAHEDINCLANELPRPLHPQLAHFLARGSYDKALQFLETL
jgi:hypothetical protein